MGPSFNIHTIRKQARREAWNNDSHNPFRQVSRSSTVPTQKSIRQLEAGEEDGSPITHAQTEPMFASPQEGSSREGKANDFGGSGSREKSEEGRPSDPDSGNTFLGRSLTGLSTEEKGMTQRKKRGIKNFWKRNESEEETNEEDAKEKKRPWYKGKILPHKKPFTVRNQLMRTVAGSWVNILLIAAPVGIGLNYAGVNGVAIFVVNFIAIVPLAGLLGFATEEIALHVGESLGGLLNATFGNAVELIVAIIALAQDKIVVVQTSLIGSILSNLLLVMGMCFFFGGLRRSEQFFNQTVAQTAASLLALAVGALIIPTCFDQFTSTDSTRAPTPVIAALSRGTSVILLVVYLGYLYFQLHTHSNAFSEESQKVPKRPRKKALADGAISKGLAAAGGIGAGAGRANMADRPPNDELLNATAHEEADDEAEEPTLHIAVAWATLAISTVIIGLCAEFMVDSISSITGAEEGEAPTDGKKSGISIEFVGLILLPIVGNAAEHATAVTVACKDKMDLAIGVCVGSSMQVSLFLIPLLVVIGWIMGKPDMNLSFDGFQITVLFVSVLLVNYLIGDGKSHWLEGMLLQCLYLIIAVCAWYYPTKNAVTGVVDQNSWLL
ncbi:hypothetical protein HYALB_00009800 [Hymenoscyphus albidus]|uniref:Sodium/calcium exchanger membrane region domain-containing protein n=1 Tax=Hymenoscyphus albidus TaxID=595503 RepID=A0A9N9PTK3_9HELO|nr:hypothetical protein HYALB_00009800 [Hymenoscyphus albidus]